MTLVKGAKLSKDIEVILNTECQLYEQYLLLLEEERQSITCLNAEKIAAARYKRETVGQEMKAAQEERMSLMKGFPSSGGQRLSSLVIQHCHLDDSKRIILLIEKLRDLVKQSRTKGVEFGQVAQFALNMVNGSLSIIWTATQNVVRSYTRRGEINESYNPQHSRAQTVLTRA